MSASSLRAIVPDLGNRHRRGSRRAPYAPSPQAYESFWQSDSDRLYLAIPSSVPAPHLVSTVRHAVTAIDPLVAVADAHSMEELNASATARRRFLG